MNWNLIQFIGKHVDKLNLECLLVGGAVRDYLSEVEPKDYDFVCNESEKLVDSMKEEISTMNIKKFKKYGTFQTRVFNSDVEFVNPRKEAYMTWSHKPICESGTIEDDIMRRDFTINTLAIRVSENSNEGMAIIDYTKHGIDDLREKRIVCVSDPSKTFLDDPSRLIRLCIYASKGFTPSTETINDAIEMNKEITRVPLDAVKQMMDVGILFDDFMRWMYDLGILYYIIPEVYELELYEQDNKHHLYNVWEHTLQTIYFSPKIKNIKWSALFHDIGKKTTWDERENFHGHEIESEKLTKKILLRLRFSNDETREILHLVRNHMKPALTSIHNKPTKRSVGRFFRKHEEYLTHLFLLSEADIKASGVHVERDLEKINDLHEKLCLLKANIGTFENGKVRFKLNYTGNDIMNTMKIRQSPMIGDIKGVLEDKVCAGELENKWNAIDKYLRSL